MTLADRPFLRHVSAAGSSSDSVTTWVTSFDKASLVRPPKAMVAPKIASRSPSGMPELTIVSVCRDNPGSTYQYTTTSLRKRAGSGLY